MATPTDLNAAVAALQVQVTALLALGPSGYAPDCSALTASTLADAASTAKLVAAAPPPPSPVKAVIKVAGDTTIYAGFGVEVDGVASVLDAGDLLTAKYSWDFGDTTAGSQHNTYDSWSGGHIYRQAGNFTIKLTVTSETGKVGTATVPIVVNAPANFKQIYVSPTGSDTNSGATPSTPIQSITQLNKLLSNNCQVYFQCGTTTVQTVPLNLNNFQNVLIGTYGTGTAPILNYLGNNSSTASGYQLFAFQAKNKNVTIQGLNCTSPFTAKNTAPNFSTLQGTNLVFANCNAGNFGDTFLMNLNPVGVILENNTQTPGTLQGYWAFTQGQNIVIQGNNVPLPGSQYQHIVRSDGTTNLTIINNNFGTSYGQTIAPQIGSYCYAAQNSLTGPTSAGPLQNTSAGTVSLTWARFTQNTIVSNSASAGGTGPCTKGVQYDNNDITCNGQGVITIQAPWVINGTTYMATDTRIINNKISNNAVNGRAILLNGAASEIILTGNNSSASKLVVGTNMACPICVTGTDLSSFKEIGGNTLGYGTAKVSNGQSCVEIISNQNPWQGQGFTTAAAWNALAPHTATNPDTFVQGH